MFVLPMLEDSCTIAMQVALQVALHVIARLLENAVKCTTTAEIGTTAALQVQQEVFLLRQSCKVAWPLNSHLTGNSHACNSKMPQ